MTAPIVRGVRRSGAVVAGIAGSPGYVCPICGYTGPFVSGGGHYRRPRAHCPDCGAAERHRLVRAACEAQLRPPFRRTLHLAPEAQLVPFFARGSELYVTADLAGGHLMRLDVTALGLRSRSADLIVAIHVLEHVTDDDTALHEIARVLAPGGTAVIAVPTVADATIEYSAPNPKEHGHVRAPGVDWYDRLHAHFRDVCLLSSDDLPAEYQTYVYEDRTRFPNALAPERPAQAGSRHPDFVAFARV